MLSVSFDRVTSRIARRGSHTAFFADHADPLDICKAVYESTYGDIDPEMRYFGIPADSMSTMTSHGHSITWAPDGSAAFDDGSFVLHFDIADDVRLIGFKSRKPCNVDEATVKDVRLPADEFYGILTRWRDAFQADWDAADKEP